MRTEPVPVGYQAGTEPTGGDRSGRNRQPVTSRQPVVSRTCAGRLTVRRHQHQPLVDDAPSRADDRRHLATWAWLAEQAARAAPRFVLGPGDLLCLDNFRVFTAASHVPGPTGCTSCGPGATWLRAAPSRRPDARPPRGHRNEAVPVNGTPGITPPEQLCDGPLAAQVAGQTGRSSHQDHLKARSA
jgi:hypothetical protein